MTFLQIYKKNPNHQQKIPTPTTSPTSDRLAKASPHTQIPKALTSPRYSVFRVPSPLPLIFPKFKQRE